MNRALCPCVERIVERIQKRADKLVGPDRVLVLIVAAENRRAERRRAKEHGCGCERKERRSGKQRRLGHEITYIERCQADAHPDWNDEERQRVRDREDAANDLADAERDR